MATVCVSASSSLPSLDDAAPALSSDDETAPSLNGEGRGCRDPDGIDDGGRLDVFGMSPEVALRLMCQSLETIVERTGDVPPTPPSRQPALHNMTAIQAEKDETARYFARTSRGGSRASTPPPPRAEMVDGDHGECALREPAPAADPPSAGPLSIVEAELEIDIVQHRAILRRFYSKKPPPISIEDYLTRLHRYCPMSTAVVLASSLYVHRLVEVERVLSLTRRNIHRLMLGGVRTATKALEDLHYAHSRLAKVGGVSAVELGRLELGFCFLTNFDLKVDRDALTRHATYLTDMRDLHDAAHRMSL